MKNRTLVIVYWNLGIGGIQKRIRDFVNEIESQYPHWHVSILLRTKTRDGFDSQIRAGKQVTIKYYPHTGPRRMRFGFVFWLAREIFLLRPAVILTFLYGLSPVAVFCKWIFWWMRIRVVLNEGIVTSYNLAHRHVHIFPYLIRWTYPYADTVIVPTRACRDDLVQHFSVPAKKITIIPNWTLLHPIKPLTPQFDCLYVGRFHPEKRPLSMVRITKLLTASHPGIRVRMMGNGELAHQLRTAITTEGLGKNIMVMPFSQNVSETLRRAKILVVPSFAEGMPNVVLEAAMCGIPSVVSSFPGAGEVVLHGKTGYVAATDVKMALHIRTLLSHPVLRRRMGEAARRHCVRNFSHGQQKTFITCLLTGATVLRTR